MTEKGELKRGGTIYDRLTPEQRKQLVLIDHLLANKKMDPPIDPDLEPEKHQLQQAYLAEIHQAERDLLTDSELEPVFSKLIREVGVVATLALVRIIIQVQPAMVVRIELLRKVSRAVINELTTEPFNLTIAAVAQGDQAGIRQYHRDKSGLFFGQTDRVNFEKLYDLVSRMNLKLTNNPKR